MARIQSGAASITPCDNGSKSIDPTCHTGSALTDRAKIPNRFTPGARRRRGQTRLGALLRRAHGSALHYLPRRCVLQRVMTAAEDFEVPCAGWATVFEGDRVVAARRRVDRVHLTDRAKIPNRFTPGARRRRGQTRLGALLRRCVLQRVMTAAEDFEVPCAGWATVFEGDRVVDVAATGCDPSRHA
jgi:hypothetical protein